MSSSVSPSSTSQSAGSLDSPSKVAVSTAGSATNEVLVSAEGVRKKFCRRLKRSLLYGAQDVAREALGMQQNGDRLRKDEFWAVNDVSFELRRGECIGLIGHNGAGKTTLLKMLNGLIRPDAGHITMRGRVGALIALGAGFNPILTGRENVYVNASVLGLSKKEIDEKFDEILDFAEIGDFIDAPVQSYSSGMQVRLGFAVAANLNPDVLLLDEVLAVGDMAFQAKCFNTLARYRSSGSAFILVSHYMHHIMRYCDKVVYLHKGQIRFAGDTEEAVNRFRADQDALQSKEVVDENRRACGTGLLRFTGIQFSNPGGEPISTIKSGARFVLEVRFRCEQVLPNPVVLDVAIHGRDGMLFQSTSGDSGVTFCPEMGTGVLRTVFDGIPVSTQSLRFGVALLDAKTQEVIDWADSESVEIQGRGRGTGMLDLPSHWTMQ